MVINKFIRILSIPILVAGVILTQYFFDNAKKRVVHAEPIVPQASDIRAIDLGLHNAAADIAWLTAVQYLGGNDSKSYQRLSDYLELSTDLDPKFSYPYAFGVLVLPGLGQVDQAIALAEKGIEKAQPDWRIPYYLATTYHSNKNDRTQALKYFDIAANTPGAPENIQAIAANYGTRQDVRDQTKLIWQGIYETTKDEVVRERAAQYLVHYQIIDILEQAAKEYQRQNGSYPSKIAELITANIIRAIPPDPFGLNFIINSATGRVSVGNEN